MGFLWKLIGLSLKGMNSLKAVEKVKAEEKLKEPEEAVVEEEINVEDLWKCVRKKYESEKKGKKK